MLFRSVVEHTTKLLPQYVQRNYPELYEYLIEQYLKFTRYYNVSAMATLSRPPTVPPPVYLSLSSTNYLSGLSEIPLSSVGEGSGLVCHTDLASCCEGNTGDWYYPNGSVVMEDGALYVSRGQMSVSLMMSGTATAPGGVYCCVVPTSGGRDTACIVLSIMLSTHSITVTASTDESSVSDNTGAVVGGVVALVAVIAVTIVMVAYLVFRYKRGGKM